MVLGDDHRSSWAKFVRRRVGDGFDCLRRLGPKFVSHQQTFPLEKLLLALPLRAFRIAGTCHVVSTCAEDRLFESEEARVGSVTYIFVGVRESLNT
jgi:hypothetical protein